MRCACGNLIERPFFGNTGQCIICYLEQEIDDDWEVVDGDVCPDCGGELEVDWNSEQVSCTRCGWRG